MRIADIFKGKTGRELGSLISDSVVIELVEITTTGEITNKLEIIKKALSRSSSSSYLVVVFKG